MEGIGAGAKGAGIFANVKLTAPPPAPGQKSSGLSFPKPAPEATRLAFHQCAGAGADGTIVGLWWGLVLPRVADVPQPRWPRRPS